MRIAAISDLHGTLPEIPECDLLLIAGDICPIEDHSIPAQQVFLDGRFREWLQRIPATKVVGIAGNHDLIFEHFPARVPKSLRWKYLEDQETTIGDLRIFGSPWQLPFCDWAFNAPEEKLSKLWSGIEIGTDIIVTHGPPLGYGDRTIRGDLCGSKALLSVIGRVKPRLVVFGHIHEGRGQWNIGSTTLANVTILDEAYRWKYEPMMFDL